MTTPISFDKSVVDSIVSPYVAALASAHSPLDLGEIRKDDIVKDAAKSAGINVDDQTTYNAFTRALFEAGKEINQQSGNLISVHEPKSDVANGSPVEPSLSGTENPAPVLVSDPASATKPPEGSSSGGDPASTSTTPPPEGGLSGDPASTSTTPPPKGSPSGDPASTSTTKPLEGSPSGGDPASSSTATGGTQTDPTAGTQPKEEEPNGWSKWRSPILLGLGILAVIGTIFSSAQGSKGKPLLAAIGGFLIGAPLLAKYGNSSWLSWLFGANGEQKTPESTISDGATTTQS